VKKKSIAEKMAGFINDNIAELYESKAKTVAELAKDIGDVLSGRKGYSMKIFTAQDIAAKIKCSLGSVCKVLRYLTDIDTDRRIDVYISSTAANGAQKKFYVFRGAFTVNEIDPWNRQPTVAQNAEKMFNEIDRT